MKLIALLLLNFPLVLFAQMKWQNVDSNYQPLPSSFHVYFQTIQLMVSPTKRTMLLQI